MIQIVKSRPTQEGEIVDISVDIDDLRDLFENRTKLPATVGRVVVAAAASASIGLPGEQTAPVKFTGVHTTILGAMEDAIGRRADYADDCQYAVT